MASYVFLSSAIFLIIGILMIILGRKKKSVWIPGLILSLITAGIILFMLSLA